LKPIIKKLTYIGKTSFNNDTTIHFALAIPIISKLNDERCDILITTYTQLQPLIINEISLVGDS
jgi:hypothetical protein